MTSLTFDEEQMKLEWIGAKIIENSQLESWNHSLEHL